MTAALFAALAVGWAACFYFGFWRNNRVYRFRGRLLAVVFDPRNPNWRADLDAYHSVTYGQMVLSFRPLPSFYAGTTLGGVR